MNIFQRLLEISENFWGTVTAEIKAYYYAIKTWWFLRKFRVK